MPFARAPCRTKQKQESLKVSANLMCVGPLPLPHQGRDAACHWREGSNTKAGGEGLCAHLADVEVAMVSSGVVAGADDRAKHFGEGPRRSRWRREAPRR